MQQAAAFDHALSLLESGRIAEALPLLQDLQQRFPRDARVNFSLGAALSDSGHDAAAVPHLKAAAAVARKKAIVFEKLAHALLMTGDADAALEAGRKALKLDPGTAGIHVLVGNIYASLSRPVLAEQAYSNALKLEPANPHALTGLGNLRRSLGRIEESATLYRRAIAADGPAPEAYWGLAQAQRFAEEPPELSQIERLLADGPHQPPEAIARLHWAAGKILDDLGEAARALAHFDAGRRRLYPPYDPQAEDDRIAAMVATFDERFFRDRRDLGFASEKPVFVVGMPRSGTTLVEQIIARHSQAVGAGELTYFSSAQTSLGLNAKSPAEFARIVAGLDEKELRRIGRKYLALLDGIGGKALRVVDKYPQNFNRLWLLAILFPNATYIHCQREPVDTCLSILTTPLKRQHTYNASQEALGHYYRGYRRLMDHWHKVLPVKVRDQSYEALVASQEAESRELIANTGLKWEDACLEFYKGERPVMTFSQQQVRQPIFSSSVGKWRRYEAHIRPLLAALGDLAPPRD